MEPRISIDERRSSRTAESPSPSPGRRHGGVLSTAFRVSLRVEPLREHRRSGAQSGRLHVWNVSARRRRRRRRRRDDDATAAPIAPADEKRERRPSHAHGGLRASTNGSGETHAHAHFRREFDRGRVTAPRWRANDANSERRR